MQNRWRKCYKGSSRSESDIGLVTTTRHPRLAESLIMQAAGLRSLTAELRTPVADLKALQLGCPGCGCAGPGY
jgi:hypothetical protein